VRKTQEGKGERKGKEGSRTGSTKTTKRGGQRGCMTPESCQTITKVTNNNLKNAAPKRKPMEECTGGASGDQGGESSQAAHLKSPEQGAASPFPGDRDSTN
jgi:hypothetical protein